jgi:VanZ family protein
MNPKLRLIAKICSLMALAVLLAVALGPEAWTPRSGLGFRFNHFAGYFVITSIVCSAWPRPLMVGGGLMVMAVLLEGLQALTPDRHASLVAAGYAAGGVLAAALLAAFIMQRGKRA